MFFTVTVLMGDQLSWQYLLVTTSLLSFVAGIVSLCFLTEGPYVASKKETKKERKVKTETTSIENKEEKNKEIKEKESIPSSEIMNFQLIYSNKAFWWSTLGYCGHNWELYALWLWFKRFALDYKVGLLLDATDPSRGSSIAAFFVVGSAIFGSVGAGIIGDKIGRTTVCLISLSVSIVGSLCISLTKGAPVLTFIIGLLWGMYQKLKM